MFPRSSRIVKIQSERIRLVEQIRFLKTDRCPTLLRSRLQLNFEILPGPGECPRTERLTESRGPVADVEVALLVTDVPQHARVAGKTRAHREKRRLVFFDFHQHIAHLRSFANRGHLHPGHQIRAAHPVDRILKLRRIVLLSRRNPQLTQKHLVLNLRIPPHQNPPHPELPPFMNLVNQIDGARFFVEDGFRLDAQIIRILRLWLVNESTHRTVILHDRSHVPTKQILIVRASFNQLQAIPQDLL